VIRNYEYEQSKKGLNNLLLNIFDKFLSATHEDLRVWAFARYLSAYLLSASRASTSEQRLTRRSNSIIFEHYQSGPIGPLFLCKRIKKATPEDGLVQEQLYKYPISHSRSERSGVSVVGRSRLRTTERSNILFDYIRGPDVEVTLVGLCEGKEASGRGRARALSAHHDSSLGNFESRNGLAGLCVSN
jgi:hypothetical protein